MVVGHWSKKFVTKLLKEDVVPFIETNYLKIRSFQKTTQELIRQKIQNNFFNDEKIDVMEWLSHSPETSLIESVEDAERQNLS